MWNYKSCFFLLWRSTALNINPFEMSTKPTLHIQIELSLYLSSISLSHLLLFNATQILPRNQTKEEVYDSQRFRIHCFIANHPFVMFVNAQHFRNIKSYIYQSQTLNFVTWFCGVGFFSLLISLLDTSPTVGYAIYVWRSDFCNTI